MFQLIESLPCSGTSIVSFFLCNRICGLILGIEKLFSFSLVIISLDKADFYLFIQKNITMKKKEVTTPFLGYNVDEFSGRFLNDDVDTPPKEEFPARITPDPNGMSVYFSNDFLNSNSNEFH